MDRAKLMIALSGGALAALATAAARAQQPPAPPPANPPAQQQFQAPTPPAPAANPAPQRGPRGFSADDRAAFFDARIAAVHAGLKLTPDQEQLWPPVESAVRDMARVMTQWRDQRQNQPAADNPIDRLARAGDFAAQRGAAMKRLADAARPLYASLSDDQKRRLRVLMRAGQRGGPRGMEMGRDDGPRGRRHDRFADRWDDRDHGRGFDRGDRERFRDDDGPGRRWNDWR